MCGSRTQQVIQTLMTHVKYYESNVNSFNVHCHLYYSYVGPTGVAITCCLFTIVVGFGIKEFWGDFGDWLVKKKVITKETKKKSFTPAFEIFAYTHWLAIAYFGIMMIHAPQIWPFLCAPIGLLCIEWGLR